MIDLRDLHQKTVCISGSFAGWSKAELEILLRARGAWRVASSPSRGVTALISAEEGGPKVAKAAALGIPVVLGGELRAALGAPLEGYRWRLERTLSELASYQRKAILAIGAPASEALLARVEVQVGFPLPPAARALWTQLDGLSLLWTIPELPGPTSTEPLPWSEACHAEGPLWTRLHALRAANPSHFGMGMACIPPLETLFFTPWEGRMFSGSAYGPKDTLQLGRRKVRARALFEHLYCFDLFSPFTFAGLWADQEQQALHVVYATDHGADWSMAATVPFEVYLESLLLDLARTRPIEPTAKIGWPKGIRRLAHKAWVELSPFEG